MSEPIALSAEDIGRIVLTFERWGSSAEHRDEPIMAMLDGTEISPRDIGRAMREPESRLYVHMLDLVAADVSTGEDLNSILSDFEAPGEAFK